MAIGTTLISPVSSSGRTHTNVHVRDGICLTRARRRKERTYPELLQEHGRARLGVLAIEIGGRWSNEAMSFVQQLAHCRSRSEPEILRKMASISWLRRWIGILSCACQRTFAGSLLFLPGHLTSNLDGPVPFIGDVLCDDRWTHTVHFSRIHKCQGYYRISACLNLLSSRIAEVLFAV